MSFCKFAQHQMKKKRGRKKGSGVKSSIKGERHDIRARLFHGHRDYRIVRLCQLVLAVKKEEVTAQRDMLLEERKACRDEQQKGYDKAIRESNELLAALEQGNGNAWRLADNHLSARRTQAGFPRHVCPDNLPRAAE